MTHYDLLIIGFGKAGKRLQNLLRIKGNVSQ